MTIAILEDDETLREGLRDLFLSAGYTVRAAGLLRDAERIAEAELWLVDLMLPDGSGLDFVRGLRAAGDVPVIILTALDDEESIIRGLRAGADDYITKPFRAGELLARAEANLRRVLPDSYSLRSGDLTYSFPDERVHLRGEALTLREKERRLLKLLLESRGQLLTRDQLLYRLWDQDENYVDENTLSVLVSRLRKALGRFQGEEYIETVRGIGYRWRLPCRIGGPRT